MDPTSPTNEMSDAAPASLRDATMSGGRWVAIENLFLQLMQTVTTLVLARLLDEDDFGIIALILLVNGFFILFTEFGLGAALVQRQDRIDEQYVSTSFWASAGLGFFAGGLAALLAAPIADAFNTPEATPFLQVGALVLPFGLMTSIPTSVLARNLRFRSRSLVKMSGTVVYLVVTIVLAVWFDAGAWAVVAGWVSRAAWLLVGAMLAARWRPRFSFSGAILREDLSFNAGFLGSRVSSYFAKNVDYWYTARALGDEALGQYYIAYVLPNMVRQRITLVVQQSLFPVLSRAKSQQERFEQAFLQTLRFVTLTTIPLLVGLSAVAAVAVPVVFGAKWIPIAAPMAILAIGSAFDAQTVVARVVILSAGKPTWNLVLGFARVAVLGLALIWAWFEGTLSGVAWAVLISTVASALMHHAAVLRLTTSTWTALAKAIAPALVPAAVMYGGVRLAEGMLEGTGLPLLLQLIALVALGGALFGVVGLLLHRSAYRGLWSDMVSAFVPGRGKRKPSDEERRRRQEERARMREEQQ